MLGLNKWMLLGGGILVLLLGAAVAVQTARLGEEQVRRGAETKRADDNAATAKGLQENANRNAAIAANQAAALARLDAARIGITREIIRVPDSTACRDAPAIRAALDGLRRWPGAAPDPGRPAAAGGRPGAMRGPSGTAKP